MLFDLIYTALDRLRRPLQNHHYVVLPHLNLAYGRVPKVANSSIKRVLARQIDFKPTSSLSINQDPFWAHKDNHMADLVTAADLRRRYPDVFVFSFVRNPFDRLISCYVNKIIKNDDLTGSFRRLGFAKGMTFEAFVDAVAAINDRAADNHFRSQASILTFQGAVVPEFIGHLETVDTDWETITAEVKRRSGVDLGLLEQRHVSQRDRGTDLAQFFNSAALIEAARARYRDDFKIFYPDIPDPALVTRSNSSDHDRE